MLRIRGENRNPGTSAEVNAISLRIASLDLEAPFLCLLADHSSLYQQERRFSKSQKPIFYKDI